MSFGFLGKTYIRKMYIRHKTSLMTRLFGGLLEHAIFNCDGIRHMGKDDSLLFVDVMRTVNYFPWFRGSLMKKICCSDVFTRMFSFDINAAYKNFCLS